VTPPARVILPLDAPPRLGYMFGVTELHPATPRARRVRGRTIVLVSAALIIAIAVTAIALPLWQAKHRRPTLGDYGKVPAFALTDETGAPFTEAALRGHVTIVNFVFTRCDTICPVSSMKMHRIQEETEDRPELHLVSFSVDPAYDTPARLAAYATRFNADPSRWRFVTGDEKAVRKVVEDAMMISMDPDGRTMANGAPNIVHQPHFLLIDRDLTIAGLYDSTDPVKLEMLVRDARDLARP
jgi:protein SCO1